MHPPRAKKSNPCLADDFKVLDKSNKPLSDYIKLFNQSSNEIPLVDMVLKRETSFTESYNLVSEVLAGFNYLHMAKFPEQYRGLVDDLIKTVGASEFHETNVLCANPEFFVGLMTPAALASSPLIGITEKRLPTRREILYSAAGLGIGGGLVCGLFSSSGRAVNGLFHKSNAKYLDSKVQSSFEF